jgi:hypothetical protein
MNLQTNPEAYHEAQRDLLASLRADFIDDVRSRQNSTQMKRRA